MLDESLRLALLADVAEGKLSKLLQEDRLLITSYGLLRRDLAELVELVYAPG